MPQIFLFFLDPIFLEYFLLKFVPKKEFEYLQNESISFDGDTGPYMQYSFVRIKKILDKIDYKIQLKDVSFELLVHDSEKAIIKQLFEYPELLEKAATDYDPSKLTQYISRLCQTLNVFYENCRVLGSEPDLEKARVFLLSCIAIVLKNSLKLCGIETVESM